MTTTAVATQTRSLDTMSALATVASALTDVRTQVHALNALEATLLTAGNQIAGLIAAEEGATDHGEFAHRTVAAELALAVRESDRAMAFKMGRAVTLVTDYPVVHEALMAGTISQAHAHAIIEAGNVIADTGTNTVQRDEYAAAALKIAEQDVVGRVRPVVKELAEQYADRTLDERHRDANACRMVRVRELDDGMAELSAVLSATLAHGIKDRLSQMAIRVKNTELAHERTTKQSAREATKRATSAGGRVLVRSVDQIRADLFTDMLLTGDPNTLATPGETGLDAIKARVQVIVPKARVTPTPGPQRRPAAATDSAPKTETAPAARPNRSRPRHLQPRSRDTGQSMTPP